MAGSPAPRATAFRAVLRDPRLRRIQLADAGSVLGSWGFVVALGVFAYEAGGPTLVGVATLARFAPQALTASLAGALVRRWTRRGLMVRCDLTGALVLLAAAALLVADAPAWTVLALVALKSAVGAWFRPAKASLVPALTRRPEELTAMNVVSGLIENVGMFGGPALGGLLLAGSSPQVVFAASGLLLVWSAWQVRGIAFTEEPMPGPLNAGVLVAEMRDGLSAVAGSGPLRAMMVLLTLQTLVAGAWSVLVVVVALDLLGRGPGWVGYLEGAAGVGGVLGAAAASMLVGRPRMSGAFGLAMMGWGAPIVLLAVLGGPAPALALMVVLGAANSVGDVAYLTMLQRAVPEEQIARVFGGLDAVVISAMAVGGIVGAQVVDAFDVDTALITFGTLLPAATALAWRRLRLIDASAAPSPRVLELLRRLPTFAVLPPPALERLALAAVPVQVEAGGWIFQQGEGGDHCYLVDSGSVEVLVDGRHVRYQPEGSQFGEIALLRDVPRTASVRARDDVTLWALERDDFLAAVGASPQTAEGLGHLVAARLSYARPAMAAA